MDANQPELLEQAFISFFAGIPYEWYAKNNISEYEGYYCSVFYSFFAALGLTIKPEDMTNKGRIDFTIVMDKAIFIFEIKMRSNPQNAIKQIKEKKYHEKYLKPKIIHLGAKNCVTGSCHLIQTYTGSLDVINILIGYGKAYGQSPGTVTFPPLCLSAFVRDENRQTMSLFSQNLLDKKTKN